MINEDMLPRMPPDREAVRAVVYDIIMECAGDFTERYKKRLYRGALVAEHAASTVYTYGLNRGILSDKDGAYFFGNRPYKEEHEPETDGIFPERQVQHCREVARKEDAEISYKQAVTIAARMAEGLKTAWT